MPSKLVGVMWNADCDVSGGVTPYRYRKTGFVNSLQWAIGLAMFLLGRFIQAMTQTSNALSKNISTNFIAYTRKTLS